MVQLDGLKIILNGTSEEKFLRRLGKKLKRNALVIYPPAESLYKKRFDEQKEKLKTDLCCYLGKFSDYFKGILMKIEDNQKLAQGHNMPRYR